MSETEADGPVPIADLLPEALALLLAGIVLFPEGVE
jgi:hypothetical protein